MKKEQKQFDVKEGLTDKEIWPDKPVEAAVERFQDRAEVPEVQADVPVVQDDSPNAPIMLALQKNYSPEFIEKMMDLAERNERNIARRDHFEAVAAFKAEAPPLKKDKWNDWLKCWYTSLGQLLETYNPILGKHGLSISFAPPRQDEKTMTVECLLSHRSGHVTSVPMTGPIDVAAIGGKSGKPSRNPMQDLRSTFTYLRATTCEAILGVSGTEATKDDDGNAAGKVTKEAEFITEGQVNEITDRLKAIYGDDPSMFMSWLGVETVDTIPAKEYRKAIVGIVSGEKAKAEAEKANRDESELGE